MTSELWEFPWPQPKGTGYDTDGPTISTAVQLVGATYVVEPTGDTGLHSGRDRFRVVCLTCDQVLHENTTGPSSRIRHHHKENHGK